MWFQLPFMPTLRTSLPVTLLAMAFGLVSAASAGAQVTLYRDAGFSGRSQVFHGPVEDLRHTAIGNDRASAVDVAPGCVAILYRDVRFRGRSIEVSGPIPDLGRTVLGNDRVSSLDVRCADRGRRGRGRWSHGDRGGWDHGDWDRGDWDRGHERWERDRRDRDRWDRRRDRRGGRYDRRSEGVVLYRNAGFRDARLETLGSIADLGRTPLGNDRLSSLSVPRGCTAIVYEHSHFRGRAIAVDGDLPDLGRTRLGNDRASSIEVRCR